MSQQNDLAASLANLTLDQNCAICKLPDNDRMVTCVDCQQLYHHECAGVNDDTANQRWSCRECCNAKNPNPPPPSSVLPPHGVSTASSAQSSIPANHSANQQLNPIAGTNTAVEPVVQSFADQLPVELRLKFLEEEEALERKYLLKRYKLLMEASSSTAVKNVTPVSSATTISNTVVPQPQFQPSSLPPQAPLSEAAASQQTQGQSVPLQQNPLQQPRTSSPIRPSAPVGYPNDLSDTQYMDGTTLLNRSQVAARHAVSKDLPVYSGDPEEWPLFFATYENTTRLCGFTPEENTARLQKCLRGKALEAVKCQLLHPTNVEQVLATLKMLFGRPEIIVHSLMQKIITLPAPKAERLNTLVDFAVAVRNMVATVQACKLEEHLCNLSLLQSLVDRLPPMIKLNWATHRQSLHRATLSEFSDWLYKLAEAASVVTLPQFRGRKDDGYLNAHSETDPKQEAGESDQKKCIVCSGACAKVDECKQFISMDHSYRWATLRERKLCRSCLGDHRGQCRFGKVCGLNGCPYKHHQLLHNNAKDKPNPGITHPSANQVAESSNEATHPVDTSHVCNTHRGDHKTVLFQYVPVTLHSQGTKVQTFAFLDSGSSLTLIEEDLAKQLNLKGEKHPLCLRWTADTCRYEESARRVNLEISGPKSEGSKHQLQGVYTVKELKLPRQSLSAENFSNQYAHLRGLPLESYSNIQPKILIGMNNVRLLHAIDSREGQDNEPVAIKTRLGWTIYGTSSVEGKNGSPHSFHICFHSSDSDASLHEAVKDYFALESIGISAPNQQISTEDERALKMLREKTSFVNGRYQTGLLWKYDDLRLPQSRSMALRRHHCLIKRMQREPELAMTLREKMADYERKGYIQKLSPAERLTSTDRTWYLPIFPVFNPNKPGKVRIVWDAAATVGGVSLNTALVKGPDLMTSLPSVLYKFRERAIGICGDIAGMFHQVAINETDQQSQRFLWCDNENSSEPADYVMKVMSFGATCSPSSAIFVLNENASRFESQYPVAVDAIRKRHYVDDMLTSTDSEEDAIKLAKEVHYIHQQGGFHMRNWISNSPRVLEALGEGPKHEKCLEISSGLSLDKVLGMWWNTTEDVFCYKLSTERNRELLTGNKHPTKRDVLRTLMAVYDPLGLISHYLMYLKTLLQEIWRAGTGWDEPIGEKQLQKWNEWVHILPEVEAVSIPRCYFRLDPGTGQPTVELHTFTDASELGYAAVSYLRFELNGVVKCALVGSKTRVAPLKFVSIPRLELQAAVVGARLAKSIENGHSIKINRRYFWTDARDVLCWLQSDHRRYSQFVAFRVGEILELTDIDEWKWVPTKLNVADEGTKWQQKPGLTADSRWFNGPSFLWKQQADWPISQHREQTTVEEIRPNVLHHTEIQIPTFLRPKDYSCWRRLCRVTAYIYRYTQNLKRKVNGQALLFGPLTQEELLRAEVFHIKNAQSESFTGELLALQQATASSDKPKLPKNNPLYKVKPFIDENGVMRIHTRLGECDFVETSTRFPIVLSRTHPLTLLIVLDVHQRYHHQCHETCVNEIRKKFYIPRLRVVYSQARRNCQLCKLLHAMPNPPAMADLPKPRVAAFVRPFSYVGVDYFGPLYVTVFRRSEKRWGLIVTCLTTRGIHLELVNSLDTSSCILALRNCFARRGTPLQIISDRGTNFVRADKELREAFKQVDLERIMSEFTSPTTVWSFNPPASAHMGGSWERLVQSVKKILMQIKPQRYLPEEVLRNLLIEIENIINSRPLTYVPVDDESSPALTPNHFLVGSSNGSKPPVPFNDSSVALRQSWKSSQILANYFWKRWVNEYLPTITRRTKWFYPAKPISVGDIVIIVDSNFPRNCWPKGRVVSVKTSTDGQVRSAVVQTATGLYERPAVKLAVLDVGTNVSESDQGPTTGGDCCVYPSVSNVPPSNIS